MTAAAEVVPRIRMIVCDDHTLVRESLVNLLQASGDPNEADRSIVIQPVMSGFRDKEQSVTFNTDYFQADERLPDVRLLLPMRTVQSISNFDDDIHSSFVARGITRVEPAEPEEGYPLQWAERSAS